MFSKLNTPCKPHSCGTFYIKTFGCSANVADSEAIANVLEGCGFVRICPDSPITKMEDLRDVLKNCDIFVINSCSVRQKSEDKVYGLGKLILELKASTNKDLFVILAGCMVGSATGDRKRYELAYLGRKMPWVDLMLSPSQVNDLLDILQKHPQFLGKFNQLKTLLNNELPISNTAQSTSKVLVEPVGSSKQNHAFINISTGCDNFCSYCVVPFARGPEISRTREVILKEIIQKLQHGCETITLCGQNVNSWGLTHTEKRSIRTGSDQKLPFANLLREVHALPGLEKIDFISSNPFDFTIDLIDALKLPKISNYIHIAVQSGNDDILKKMNRRHTVAEFIALIEKIRKVKPIMELGTDIIVGFPGETREQFYDTVRLLEHIKFNVVFIAMYSPRKGTAAEKLYPDDVLLAEKKWRHQYLMQVCKRLKVTVVKESLDQ